MELEVSHRICAEISKESILWGKAERDRRNTADAVQLEEDQDHRGRGMPGPRAHVGGDTAKGVGIQFHGISEGKEQPDDL